MNAQPNPANGFTNWLRKHPGSALVYFIVLPVMACAVLMLPPIALPSRIANAGYIPINTKGATVSSADGFEITIPENAIRSGTSMRMTTMSLDNFLNSDLSRTLPMYLEPRGPLYQVAVQGEQPRETHLLVPIPLEIESFDTVDLMALWNQRWFKIPFIIDENSELLESTLNFAPEAVVVVETLPRAPVIAANISNSSPLPNVVDNLLVQVNPRGLALADDGSIAGEPVGMAETNLTSNFSVLPTVTNVDANGARTDLVANMMLDEVQRTAHINALVDLAVQKVYRGYNLSYEGIPSGDQEMFTAFVKDLARELHAKQKILSVTLPAPTPISEQEFDTGGYNWPLIARYADQVKIPLLNDPRSFEGEPTLQDQYLKWAVGQIDRSKIQLVLSTQGRDSTADTYTPVPFGDALKLVGAVNVPPDAAPGTRVTIEMDGLARAGGIQTHQASGLFYFNYQDTNGTQHTVWLENADSIAKQIAFALHYNLGGVALNDFDANSGMDERIWTVLENYRSMQPTIVENQLQLVWSVDNNQIGTSSVSDPKIVWDAPQDDGQHQIQVALSVDGGVTAGVPVGSVVQLAQAATPTPVAPTAEPTQEAPKPTAKPNASNQGAQPTASAPAAQPTTKPAAPPPAAGGNFAGQNLFNYGIQIDWTSKDRDVELSHVQGMGFRWVKVQVRWCDMESSKGAADLSGPDDIVARANARGVKVLFSVLCAPEYSRSNHQGEGPPDNMQDAADFFGGLASRYCNTALGAIEVWNEENLQREWNGAPLSAARYMDMLKAVYPAIKNACPSMVVVSGAPTPTGWNDGVVAIDDQQYLEQLYQNGLKDFSDAVGAHPSGYNVPALCNITDPACNRPEASFRSPFDNRHPSWSFLSTMTGYRSVMARHGDSNKQIWATEFGWPIHTGGSCGGGPCHPAGADNSPTQAGQWYVEAYQWGKQQGWVGVMIAWQLDFDRGELDAFRILGNPAYDMLAAMPK